MFLSPAMKLRQSNVLYKCVPRILSTGGMCGKGACMAGGACMVGGHVQPGGMRGKVACVARGV